MTIPLVMQGTIETEGGKVFELDSPKGAAWLESIGSFRFEPSGDNKPYTVRKESGKGGDYWYGYRKQDGKLHKKYIGKSSEISTAKLEEIAEALNTPPQPRVTDKTIEVTEKTSQGVTDKVTIDRLTALELQVQALQESLEVLRSELPGKSDADNSLELPKVDNEVAERLHNELSNLKTENEALKQELEKVKYDYSTLVIIDKQLNQQLEEVTADRAKLLESSTVVTDNLRRGVRELQARLEVERADREEIEVELADLKQKSATAGKDLPDAADLLNQLKARRKKSTASLADVESILEIIEESW